MNADQKLVQLTVKTQKTQIGKVVAVVAPKVSDFSLSFEVDRGVARFTFPATDNTISDIRTAMDKKGLSIRVQVF